MALFAQNMLEISLELASRDPAYAEMASKYIEHFLWIAGAMDRVGDNDDELWDEEDGFFYDLLRLPDGSGHRLKVRSLVGLLPLCAVTVIPGEIVERYPDSIARIRRFIARHPDLTANIAAPGEPGVGGRRLLAVLDERKLRRVLARMLDEGSSSRRSASARSRGRTWITRTSCRSTARPTASPTSPRSRPPACSAATPTGAGRSGSRSTC